MPTMCPSVGSKVKHLASNDPFLPKWSIKRLPISDVHEKVTSCPINGSSRLVALREFDFCAAASAVVVLEHDVVALFFHLPLLAVVAREESAVTSTVASASFSALSAAALKKSLPISAAA